VNWHASTARTATPEQWSWSLELVTDRKRTKLRVEWREQAGMGRFGGGWQWKLGFQTGTIWPLDSGDVILNLLFFTVRLDWKPKEKA
jgi:hypothetical protein